MPLDNVLRRVGRCHASVYLTLLALALAPAAARATVPGHWDPVTAPTGANIDQVALLRTPDGSLHVVWHQDPPGSDVGTALMHTVITPNGKVGPAQTIVSGWAGIGDAAIVRSADGDLLLFAPATRSTSGLDPLQSIEQWTSPDDGASWALSPQPIAMDGGFANPLGGFLGPDGATPFVAWGTSDGLLVHRGTDDTVPNANLQSAAGFSCCGIDPGVALDGASGTVVVAWYGIVAQGNAVYARTVDPSTGQPIGTTMQMPGTIGTNTPNQHLGLTGVPDQPGVWAVYTGGGVLATKILVWKVGGAAATTIAANRAGGFRTPAISVTPDGRLWVAWSGNGRIWAARSNRARTRWGAVTSIPIRRGTQTVYNLATSAQTSRLDLLAAFSPSSTGGVQTWHSQIDPGLTVTARPSRPAVRPGGSVTLSVTVSDAGSGVSGATVTVAGHRGHTGARGTLSVKLGPFARATTLHVAAAKRGYASATAAVRVRVG
jgi:hypothetical protein